MSGSTQDWFYHAPSKKNTNEAKDYPAASQIPALGGGLPYDEWEKNERDQDGMKRGWVRDSDSKYIQLCKKGGRKDLLQMRDPKPRNEEAKDYPRPDWFYQEEAAEAPNTSAQYKSHLPDYMVYEEYHPDEHGDEGAGHWQRPPFSLDDKMTAFERHGDGVTDKMNLKIPNDPSKLRRPMKSKVDDKDYRRKKEQDQNKAPEKSRHAKIPTPDSYQGPASMGKLLSNGYNEDWYTNRDSHQKNHKVSSQDALFEAATKGDRQSTEYRDAINKNAPRQGGGFQGGGGTKNAMEVRGTKKSEQMKAVNNKQEENRELFKISKFDKVGAKVNSRWSETHERSSPLMDAAFAQERAVANVHN